MAVIYNWIDRLPWHPTKRWQELDINEIKYIIIHQPASNYKKYSTKDIEGINSYCITPSPNNHLSKSGVPHVPYTVSIDDNGDIYICNMIGPKKFHATCHAKKYNFNSIGIMVVGMFDGPSFINENHQKPTKEQLQSLKETLDGLLLTTLKHVEIKNILGHCEINNNLKPNCPGNILMNFIKDYREHTIKPNLEDYLV